MGLPCAKHYSKGLHVLICLILTRGIGVDAIIIHIFMDEESDEKSFMLVLLLKIPANGDSNSSEDICISYMPLHTVFPLNYSKDPEK